MPTQQFLRRVYARLARLREVASDRGSVSLEQIAITAGVTALALFVVAGIGAVVNHYTGLLNHL